MRIQRNCKVCGTEFTTVNTSKVFCHRKCFKKDYYKRTKKREDKIKKRLPDYVCGVCGNKSKLPTNLSTRDGERQFSSFICPFCGIPRSAVVEMEWEMKSKEFTVGNSMTTQFVVSSAITTTST